MFRKLDNQAGFIPMLLTVAAIVIAILYVVYSRVLRAQH